MFRNPVFVNVSVPFKVSVFRFVFQCCIVIVFHCCLGLCYLEFFGLFRKSVFFGNSALLSNSAFFNFSVLKILSGC